MPHWDPLEKWGARGGQPPARSGVFPPPPAVARSNEGFLGTPRTPAPPQHKERVYGNTSTSTGACTSGKSVREAESTGTSGSGQRPPAIFPGTAYHRRDSGGGRLPHP